MICFQPYIKYFDFSGRARRLEFWSFLFVDTMLYVMLVGVDMMFGMYDKDTQLGLFSTIFIFLALLPRVSVSVRRLHDTDHTGWWLLIGVVPFIGWLWLLILFVIGGTVGDNDYGPNPKEEAG